MNNSLIGFLKSIIEQIPPTNNNKCSKRTYPPQILNIENKPITINK